MKIDVVELENEFVNGYHEGDIIFQVSSLHGEGKMEGVIALVTKDWNNHSRAFNEEFELLLSKDKNVEKICRKMFSF